MTNSRLRWTASAVSLLLLVTACGPQDEVANADGPGQPAASHPADAVVFQMTSVGGFGMPSALAGRIPSISVYGDGRVISQGPTILIYPGPALPNLQVHPIAPEDVSTLLESARAAGVDGAVDFGTPALADAPTTRFTVRGPNGTEQIDVPALTEAGDDAPGLTADQRAARTQLRAFVTSLTGDSGPLAPTKGDSAQPYVPTTLAGIAEPYTDEEGLGQPEVAWPGPTLPGEPLGTGNGPGCVTVTGDALRTLLADAAEITAAAPWTSDGKSWTVQLRPLLPEETSCGDLVANG
ncbi:hypothetical protein [Salinispora tropica]|uniref:Lipoprotein n=1 Tax=Salinispora tropica (strain ATCC BAA-916 / DSM 44818 / JCM 13857 / NBRC 105044 / CNB-440) TaxID=369723 RepID=A4X827_SALTO|nr:hypothetical protein [Salinispora tropica]ABP55027.1 hypothetical protein Strop_2583 [Salinispora tropica CNB-440]